METCGTTLGEPGTPWNLICHRGLMAAPSWPLESIPVLPMGVVAGKDSLAAQATDTASWDPVSRPGHHSLRWAPTGDGPKAAAGGPAREVVVTGPGPGTAAKTPEQAPGTIPVTPNHMCVSPCVDTGVCTHIHTYTVAPLSLISVNHC